MIIDATIDGERGLYRSNVFTKTDVPALPGITAVWLGLLLAGLLARGAAKDRVRILTPARISRAGRARRPG